MEALTRIPFALDADQLIAQAHVEPGSSDAAELQSLIELARGIGNPKAGYAVCFITGRDGDAVRIDGVCFRSRTLARNLEHVERVFPLVATAGMSWTRGSREKGTCCRNSGGT